MFLQLPNSYLETGLPDEYEYEQEGLITIASCTENEIENRIQNYMDTGKQLIAKKEYLKGRALYMFCAVHCTHSDIKIKSYCNMALCLTEVGNFTEAKNQAQKALAIDDSNLKARVRLLLIEERMSNFDKVRLICKEALKIDNDNEYFIKKMEKCDCVDAKSKASYSKMKNLFTDVFFDHPSIDGLSGSTLRFYKHIKKDFDELFIQITKNCEVAKSYKIESLRNSISTCSIFRKAVNLFRDEDVDAVHVFQMIYEDLFLSDKLIDVGKDKFSVPIPRKHLKSPLEPKDIIELSDVTIVDIYHHIKSSFSCQYREENVFIHLVKNFRSPAIQSMLYSDEIEHDTIVENIIYKMHKNELIRINDYDSKLFYNLVKK